MINSLSEIFNTFTKADYPPNENNVSLVPLEHIQSFLNQNFPDNYEYKVTSSGTCTGRQGQENYVTIALKVNTTEGSTAVAGASQGNIGISGLIMGALRNAVLRGLGAGTELYQHEEGQEPNFGNGTPAPQVMPTSYAPAPQPTYQQPQYPQGGGYQNAGARPAQTFGEWTGLNKQGQPIRIKSGPYGPSQQNPMGVAWVELPQDALVGMANKGVNIAQMEMRRRAGQGQPQPQGTGQFPPNAFQQ